MKVTMQNRKEVYSIKIVTIKHRHSTVMSHLCCLTSIAVSKLYQSITSLTASQPTATSLVSFK